jgi:hypothetical protein
MTQLTVIEGGKAPPDVGRDPTTDELCELVLNQTAEMSALYEAAGSVRSRRSLTLDLLNRTVGAEIRASGKGSRTIGAYRIIVGETPIRFCACHGAVLSDCDSVGEITVLVGKSTPFLRVVRVKDAVTA